MCKKSLLMMLLLALLVPWAANAQESIPYNEGFENMSTASDLTDAGWISYQSHSGSFLAIDETSSNVHTGTKALLIDSWNAGTNNDYVVVGLPTVNAAIKTLQITFSYRISSSYGGNMEVGYLTNVDDASTFVSLQTCANSTSYATETVELNGAPNDAARIAIKYIGYYRCYVDDIEVKTLPTCFKPTGLTASYNGGNTAQVSWNSEATAWNIDVNGTVTAITTNPYTLTGLEMATTYTVKVQANCGGGDLSDWSAAKSFTTDLCMPENMCEISYQLNDSYGDGWNGNAINVTDVLTGNTITQLTMTSGSSASGSFAVCDGRQIQFSWVSGLYPGETSYTVTDANNTVIFTGSGALTEPVNYTVDCPSCLTPLNLTVSDITARSATLNWVSAGEAWQIDCNGEITNVTEKPTTLRLEPDTEYTVKVRVICGDDEYSDWTNAVTFTTLPTCYAPTDMVISDITAYTANVAWTSDNTNIEMRYAPDRNPNNDFEVGLGNWTTIDADGDGHTWYELVNIEGIPGHDNSLGLATSASYSSVALTPDNYLVSPQITLGNSISFWACAQDAGWAAEHFGVAVSTTGNTDAADFTTIAEWTFGDRNTRTLRASNAPRGGNRVQSEWVQYTVDLSAYSGQGYVAIRHFGCTDLFRLNVDDIVVDPDYVTPWVYVTNPASPQALTNLEPETNYLVQVRANCGGDDGVSRWLEGMFTTLPACMVPTNLVISNIDKRSADLAWTPNGEETAWQICVNNDENNLIDVTETTYSFTGLEPSTYYSVKVRAYCDEQLQSAWSNPVTFYTLVACPAPTNLAISDITNVSAVASWTGEGDFELQYAEDVWKHYDNGVYATSMGAGGTIYWGMMLPAESLTAGEPLTKVALHTSYAGEATLNVYLGGDQPTGTPAATQTFTMAGDGDFMEITLDTPVAIDGTQNLWITFYQSGLTYTADGCTGPTDPNGRWVSLDGETWADIAGYGYDYTWMIRAAFGNNTQTEWVTIDNATSPQAITGLTPETNYFVRVKHICGGIDGESVWTSTSFTTDVACPAPEALGATPYALSAELSWEGISESYTVSYRTAAYTEGVSEEFLSSSIPSGWTMYTGLLSAIMEGTATLSSTTYAWAFGTANGVFDSHAFCNIYSNYQRWLVTPAMEVPAGAVFSFDMALTVYTSGSSASPTPGNQADDKFVVLVSTDEMATWTILRQWDNAGSEYVYDNITNNANGEHVSFDFSAYAGQTVYIAFYGESTVSNGDNNLHIDNVAIGTAMPAGEWMTVDADEATATITGLMPETTYEWKVQGNCGEWGMSEESAIMTFTTTNDLCPVPTNLTVNNETITATTADLSWEGSPDVESFTVRYRTPEHYVGGIYADFESGTMPEGWTQSGPGTWFVNAGYGYNGIAAHGGTYNLRIGHSDRENETFLITPMMDLSGQTDPTLSFWYINYNWGASDIDQIFVYYRVDEGEWVDLWNTTEDHQEWTESGEIVLPNPSANYQVGFKMVDKYGRGVGLDDIIIGNPTLVPATDWQMVEGITGMNVTLTGLTPETTYEAQVKADCSDPEAWSNTATFTTLVQTNVTQTIVLNAGFNWISVNVEVTLDALKAALVEALPGATSIKIHSQDNGSTTYNGTRWRGQLTSLDVTQMYKVETVSSGEMTLEGMPVDPAAYPVTIRNGFNFIAYPFSQSMTLTNAFAGFVVNGDKVHSQSNGSSTYNGTRWRGQLNTLEPSKGYKFESVSTEDRTFVFPTAK